MTGTLQTNDSLNKKINYLTWQMHQNLTEKQQERWLKGVFYNLVGYMPNFKNPKTFNEKICWYRLNYSNPDIPGIVDKISFKEYINKKLGSGYTAESYGYWEDEADIPWDNLPEKFVLKSSLSSSAQHILFVNNKRILDKDKTLYLLSEWLQPWNSSNKSFSNWFKVLKPRILAEEYLIPRSKKLIDYKLFCFNGKPTMVLVMPNRICNNYRNYYDLDWNLFPFKRSADNTPFEIQPPAKLNQMVSIAERLSAPFPFVRVDLYEVNDKVFVGELTFSPAGGLSPFNPVEWDLILGKKLSLPL